MDLNCNSHLLPLGLMASGDFAEVVQPAGLGPRHGMQADRVRLEEMGLRPGTHVQVLANEGHGPLLLKLGDARVAIGRGVAMKIRVRPAEAPRRCGGGCGGCGA